MRAGSWRNFERKFKPKEHPTGAYGTHMYEIRGDLPDGIDEKYIWTVLDCDGRLMLGAGYHYVNRFGYIWCDVPWTDADYNREYVY